MNFAQAWEEKLQERSKQLKGQPHKCHTEEQVKAIASSASVTLDAVFMEKDIKKEADFKALKDKVESMNRLDKISINLIFVDLAKHIKKTKDLNDVKDFFMAIKVV